MDLDRIRIALGIIAGFASALWLSLDSAVHVLAILVVLDVASAIIAAGRRGAISSEALWDGLTRKKMLMGLIVAAAYIVQPVIANLPTGAWVAGAYCVAEFLSLIENASLAGVWTPKILKDALQKLHEQADGEERELAVNT